MSNNSFLGYGLALIVGAAAGFLAPGAGFSLFYALSAASLTAALLVRPPLPSLDSHPTDYGNSGRQQNSRQAAAESLNLNSASEALTIPVVFGTCRVNGNHIGYKDSSFRSVPIIERQERSPQAVAYAIAKEQFEASPAVVDHQIDRAARKASGVTGGKKGGGKGGGGKAPPPSKSYSDADKINAYTQVLLDNDESGKSKLPKEYDEVVIGFNYFLSFELGLNMGLVTALHGVLSYPGEKYVIDRRANPYIVSDDTAMTASGTDEGGSVRFYRGSGTQVRNVADPYAADYNNYRGVALAVFEDYKMGHAPAPNSFTFELERIPICLDANEDPIADFELRAGDDTLPVDVTEAVWTANVITITAAGHEISEGATFFLNAFEPAGYNGTFVATTVVGDVVTAALVTEPPVATTFGEAQGPPHGTKTDIDSEEWAGGLATFEVPGHGLTVGQLVEITEYTSTDWNGTYQCSLIDGDEFSVSMAVDPGGATGPGKFRAYPLPSQITAVNWEAGVATFDATNDFDDADPVIITGMNPAIYNGQFTVIDGDGSGFDVALNSSPAPATTMGTASGPSTASSRGIGHVESWTGGIVTFDLSGPEDTGYAVGDVILVEGCTPAGYNGTYTVTHRDGDQWSAALTADPGPLTVAGTATKQPAARAIESAGWLAGQANFLVTRHGWEIGDEVIIAGMVQAGYNGTFTISDVDGPDQFGVVMVDDPGAVTTFGTIRLRPDAAFGDANPAAVLYELFTNRLWGRGLSPDRIDIPSFVAASQYYKSEGIGMSFTLESQGSLSDAIETLRACVNLAVIWVGDKLYCQPLNDRSTAYSNRVILTRDMVNDPSFTRPAWPSTYNEVRVQFLNRYNNFQSELAIVHDDGNYATVGQINSTKIDLPAISSREVATLIAQRVLFDLSYPQAILKFKMSRFHSGLVPARFVEFQWPDWSAGAATTYWRVAEVTDNDQDSDGIEVTLAEDLYSTPVAGIPESFDIPIPAFEGMTRNTDADLYLASDKSSERSLDGVFVMVAELPISLTEGDRIFAFLAQRRDGFVASLTVFAKPATEEDYSLLGNVRPWAIAGVLMEPLSATGLTLVRDRPFTIQLRYASERAKFLEYCSVLPTTSDGFERLTGSEQNWMIIGNEFFEIGQAEAGAGDNTVIVTAYTRACYGSEAAAHTAGDNLMFALSFIPYAHTLRYDGLPVNVPLDFRVIPQDRAGRMGTPIDFSYTLTNLALKALRVTNAAGTVDGADWEISYRPRWHNRGADIVSDITAACNMLAGEIPTGYETRAVPLTTQGAPMLDTPALMDATFIPSDPAGLDPTTGMVEFTYDDAPDGAVFLELYQTYNGVLGLPCRVRLLPDVDTGGGGDADPTILRIDFSAADLTIMSQTGSETWQDRDLTDAQDNSQTIDWDYSPPGGSTKPTFDGTKLSGPRDGFMEINFPADAAPGPLPFNFVIDSAIASDTWASGALTRQLFLLNFGGVQFIQVMIETLTTTTIGLTVYAAEWSAPFAGVTLGPDAIPLDNRQDIGIRAENITGGSFDLTIVVDGVDGSTDTIPFTLDALTSLNLSDGGAAGLATLGFDLYAFNLSSL